LLIVDALNVAAVVVAAAVAGHLDYYYLTVLFADNYYLYLCLDLENLRENRKFMNELKSFSDSRNNL